MRSRTSRGVPEWSGGKDLYIGSPVSAIGTSFGVIDIVPGPPEGSRGPTGWGHLPRGDTWAVGGAPWPTWAKGTSPKRPMRLGFKKGRVPKGEGIRHMQGCGFPPSPPLYIGSPGGAAKGGALPPLPTFMWVPPCRWAPLRNLLEPSRYVTDKTRNFSGDQNRTSHI